MIDIKNILETAAEQQISDVHISPEKPVFLRKYRVLRPFGDIVHNQDILDFLKDINHRLVIVLGVIFIIKIMV